MKRTFAFLLFGIITIAAFGTMVFFYTKNLGKGALQVTSEPTSNIYLDGKLIGQTPFCKGSEGCPVKETIAAGRHAIKLVPTEGNFSPFEQTIPINDGTITAVDKSFGGDAGPSASIISLSKLSDKKSINLEVISFPQDAKVFLDGNFTGESPLLTSEITDSDHVLRVSKPGYKEKTTSIRTAIGYKLEVQMYLAPNPEESVVATPSATLAPKSDKIVILQTPTGFLRVRSKPSLSGTQIGLVYPGEKYDLLLEQTGWFKIKLKDEKEGWISSSYSQKEI